MTAAELDRYLPGDPSKLLARKVRRHLKGYGLTPLPRRWSLAWEWARDVRDAGAGYALAAGLRPRWPSPAEIGAQYVALMLADMRGNFALKLHHRAAESAPASVRAALALGSDSAAVRRAVAATRPAALPAAPALDLFSTTEE